MDASLELLLRLPEVMMNAVGPSHRVGIVAALALLATFVGVGQQVPKDWAVHNSSILAIATPTPSIQIEPVDGGRAQVRLTTQRSGELQIVAESFTVTMANGGFTLAGAGRVVMSGAFSLKADSATLRVSADGRSVLEVKAGVKGAPHEGR